MTRRRGSQRAPIDGASANAPASRRMWLFILVGSRPLGSDTCDTTLAGPSARACNRLSQGRGCCLAFRPSSSPRVKRPPRHIEMFLNHQNGCTPNPKDKVAFCLLFASCAAKSTWLPCAFYSTQKHQHDHTPSSNIALHHRLAREGTFETKYAHIYVMKARTLNAAQL